MIKYLLLFGFLGFLLIVLVFLVIRIILLYRKEPDNDVLLIMAFTILAILLILPLFLGFLKHIQA